VPRLGPGAAGRHVDVPGPQRIGTQNPGGAAGDRQLCLTQSAVLRTLFPGAVVYPQLGFGPIPSSSSTPDPNDTFHREGMAYRLPKNTFVAIEIGMYRVVSGANSVDPPPYGQRLDPGFDLPGFVKDSRVSAMLLSGMHGYYGF
jgi:hypothetical protein